MLRKILIGMMMTLMIFFLNILDIFYWDEILFFIWIWRVLSGFLYLFFYYICFKSKRKFWDVEIEEPGIDENKKVNNHLEEYEYYEQGGSGKEKCIDSGHEVSDKHGKYRGKIETWE